MRYHNRNGYQNDLFVLAIVLAFGLIFISPKLPTWLSLTLSGVTAAVFIAAIMFDTRKK